MTVSEIIVKTLEKNGVKQIFGIPGEENLHLLDTISKSEIQFIPARDERSAAFMAANIGRLSGRPGVVMTTVGPGATNLLTGIAYAQHGGMPMIAITAQKSVKEDHQGKFQNLDIVSLFKPVVKEGVSLQDPNMAPYKIADLYKKARTERPGVVHLEIPEDVAPQKVEIDDLITYQKDRRPVADRKLIDRVGNLINESFNPLILIGAGANRNRISKHLTRLIDQKSIYFANTQMGKGVVSEDSPYYIGCAVTPESEKIKRALKQSDLVITVGHDVYEKSPLIDGNVYKKVVDVNFYPSSIDKTYVTDIDLVGDIATSIKRLNEIVLEKTYRDDMFYQLAKVDRLSNFSDDGNSLKELVLNLRGGLDRDGILTLDNGEYKFSFASHYNVFENNTLLLDNSLATMGAGLPSAIAAKLQNPEREVVSVVGDGGFMMSVGELETARRLGLDLTIIVITDGGFGMIRRKQKEHDMERYGVDFGEINLKELAAGFGVKYSEIDPKTLKSKIRAKSKGINIYEYKTEY